jgi:hypothetical protein
VIEVTAADNRRATALVCHYGAQNLDGVNAILRETVEAARIPPLFVAVLDLHQGIIPILLTEDGLACANYMVYSLTTDEDADTTRAAQLITAHGQQDQGAFDNLMRQAADDDRFTELLVAVIVVFRTVIPQLYSELGLKVLQRNILNWAARENTTDNDQENDK